MFSRLSVQSQGLTAAGAGAVSGGGGGTQYDMGDVDGTTITEPGILVSPDYPSDHPTGELSWAVTFQAPSGSDVSITITEFDTNNTWYQRGLTPITPFVGPIVNTIYGSAISNTGTFTTQTLPWTITRSGANEMVIEFDTWGDRTGTWKLEVEFI